MRFNPDWPVLRTYDEEHLLRIALPLGGIGTGTVSLGGRGHLRDWEIMSRAAQNFIPYMLPYVRYPFFAVHARAVGRGGPEPITRALEGPFDQSEYQGIQGCSATNHGLPRFRQATFGAAYPLGQLLLTDPDLPVEARLEAFNPLVPGDADASGIPMAVLRYVISNRTAGKLRVSVAGNVPNFIGWDGVEDVAAGNVSVFRKQGPLRGIFMSSRGVSEKATTWGTLAMTTPTAGEVTYRTSWYGPEWGEGTLDFWDDFSEDGKLEERKVPPQKIAMTSLCVTLDLPARAERAVTFLITWHFPNRMTWTPRPKEKGCDCVGGNCASQQQPNDDLLQNYYTTQYRDAWDVARRTAPKLAELEEKTVAFVGAVTGSDLPAAVKEAALFNLSTLRSQTCFRTDDGRLYGWEGCNDNDGCCYGSCNHVWNYEQATAFLFGDLAMTMRDTEFAHAVNDDGLMSFRINLPISRAKENAFAAADGQMGCIMRMYREWRLSGDDRSLRRLWPSVKKCLQFAWLPGGWDADGDGVMEGSQHNTMDCEYYGPNGQIGIWYLGALRAAEEMARRMGDEAFAGKCRHLFARGSEWLDANLFNGEYYEHQIRPPRGPADVRQGTGSFRGVQEPHQIKHQLGRGCLVDQLVGQYMAHVCGLGYLVKPEHVKKTLQSILKYNRRANFHSHFNGMRGYALAGEAGLLMADFPKGRPKVPFPYFSEVMTGFEYVAAVGMLYEGLTAEGVRTIADIRDRYDGRRRSPFDEAECGHHYARAMASWAGIIALSGFQYSAQEATMEFAATPKASQMFWSNGYAWGTLRQTGGKRPAVELKVLGGKLTLKRLVLRGAGEAAWKGGKTIAAGGAFKATIKA